MNIESLMYALTAPACGIIWIGINIAMLFSTSRRWLRCLDWANWLLTILIWVLYGYLLINNIRPMQDLHFSQQNMIWFGFNIACIWVAFSLIRFGKRKYLYPVKIIHNS